MTANGDLAWLKIKIDAGIIVIRVLIFPFKTRHVVLDDIGMHYLAIVTLLLAGFIDSVVDVRHYLVSFIFAKKPP